MKRFFLIAFLSCNLLVAGRAYALPPLQLQINQLGIAEIVNIGNMAALFDGYQIQDLEEPGRLRHQNLRSVESLIAAGRIDEVLAGLGAGALGFAPAGLSPSNVAELTAGVGGTLQSGARWSLGAIFPPSLPEGPAIGFSFLWNGVGGPIPGPEFDIVVTPDIPEPSTLLLAGMGLAGLLAASLRMRRAA